MFNRNILRNPGPCCYWIMPGNFKKKKKASSCLGNVMIIMSSVCSDSEKLATYRLHEHSHIRIYVYWLFPPPHPSPPSYGMIMMHIQEMKETRQRWREEDIEEIGISKWREEIRNREEWRQTICSYES